MIGSPRPRELSHRYNLYRIHLFTRIFRKEFKFGVPKHSDLEPHPLLAKRNGNSAVNAARLRLKDLNVRTHGVIIAPRMEWNRKDPPDISLPENARAAPLEMGGFLIFVQWFWSSVSFD